MVRVQDIEGYIHIIDSKEKKMNIGKQIMMKIKWEKKLKKNKGQQDKKCIEEEEGYPLGNKSELKDIFKVSKNTS